MIYLIRDRATKQQIDEMQQELGEYIKLAVDIESEILAGGGEFHADCESILLEDGSEQQNVWGADWYPDAQEVTYEGSISLWRIAYFAKPRTRGLSPLPLSNVPK